MYDILELSKKLLPELREIAKELKKWPSTISGILKGAEQRLEALKKR